MSEIIIEPPQGTNANMYQDLRNVAVENEKAIPLIENTTSEPNTSFPAISEDNDVIELSGEFDYEGYQVVRREFFAHTKEPSFTFNNYRVYVNIACLNRFQSVDYVQALVNSDSKILALRPCREEERDAFSWCVPGSAKRKPRHITCRLFFAKIFSLMGWNPDYRYKLLGKVIHANDEYLIVFDLSATEVYQRVFKEGEKPKTSRTPVFPDHWQDQFGLPFKEHRQSMHVNIFDGYAVYAIKENNAISTERTQEAPTNYLPDDMANNGVSGGLENE
ncbi:hypothetical protein LJC56_11160 [Christensenellaceae bacterium OttesenSCG-928-K19]|nr:hypothetical protein [Christensenellaceae bacterium OttesenSCG-928-K19]